MKKLIFFFSILITSATSFAQKKLNLEEQFKNPPETAKPWLFWYWMHEAYSREGITADLQAMKDAGIGGAYLASIKGQTNPPLFQPVIKTMSPEWWELIRYTLKEADRIGVKIGMLPNDGFATAGGPAITPDLSMQKVVWSALHIKGRQSYNDTLSRPESYKGYYKDIAVLAFPKPHGEAVSTRTIVPKVTSSKEGVNPQFLVVPGNKQNFGSNDSCWIQYEFEKPFTCRNITIHVNNYNYQSQRLRIEVSDDGKNFRNLGRLQPPRVGWLDWDASVTHTIVPVTARYFRFIYNQEGSEPGAEDLDAAKWKPSLKIAGIELSAAPRIHQYEGKSGMVWRISRHTTKEQLADSLCVPKNKIIDITRFMDNTGRLKWNVPEGEWTILRIGHTSTGHMNETAGTGKGLECDKFNPEAIKLQFDSWFGEAVRVAGPELARRVLTTFHIDSWECGSQNWSPVFLKEFIRRRGYDPVLYLPAMAGIPVGTVDSSENFLHDVRTTIAELIADSCFTTLKKLAHEKGCVFTSETVAPVMVSDGMLHFKEVDIPMGEFWLRSPTHDKPNDMLDAISAARIYGKQIVQAEAFTEIRMDWDEHPGMLKALQDRNYAMGMNRLVYHVFVHNPWMDRKPGMTLDAIGLYFQRDQTWWKPGKAWVDYAKRCQVLLQAGRPVADIAVYTGEEIPRRAVLPERLVSTLPGIFGEERVNSEKERMANKGEPVRVLPKGVTAGANIAYAENWVDPLRGYAYDSFNPDALFNLAKVNNGRIELPGGASYGLLVLPEPTQMTPHGDQLSPETIKRLNELKTAGATIIRGRYEGDSFDKMGIERDMIARDALQQYAKDIAWTHRTGPGFDIYFISNQQDSARNIELSLRIEGRIPELWDAVTGDIRVAGDWQIKNGRTILPVQLDANGSVFIVLKQPAKATSGKAGKNWPVMKTVQQIEGPWQVKFDTAYGGPEKPVMFTTLQDWSRHSESSIRYYSGTGTYTKTFNYKATKDKIGKIWLDLGDVANVAAVYVNGKECGVAWTAPYRVNITDALKNGSNRLTIEVSNTWANRLIGDNELPEEKRVTRTTAPYRLKGASLLKAGLLGPVKLLQE